jgi:hypothetical protein
MSLKHFGKRSEDVYKLTTMTEISEVETYLFPLQIAVNNTDESMLHELLTYSQAWKLTQIHAIIEFIAQRDWNEGVSIVLRSDAALAIFKSLFFSE